MGRNVGRRNVREWLNSQVLYWPSGTSIRIYWRYALCIRSIWGSCSCATVLQWCSYATAWHFWHTSSGCFIVDIPSYVFFVYMPIRNLLLDTGAFGDPALPLQQRLDTAYKEFTAWLRQHKIQCSQSHFTNGMVFGIEEIPVCFATDNFWFFGEGFSLQFLPSNFLGHGLR